MISEEEIEQDELNLHENMLPLMKLLDHMDHNKINPEVPSVHNISVNPIVAALRIIIIITGFSPY